MNLIPIVAPVLEAGPVAVAADFVGRGIQQKMHMPSAMLDDPPGESCIRSLVAATIGVPVAGPASLPPIGNLAALDRSGGAVPPQDARKHLANRSGGRPGAEVSYAHSLSTPTSALVEAKIFSPSLTLS